MNLIWLDDFLALAASGNFSRAAEERHMTQPAFSRRIRALEAWLGVVLFDRVTQPATLTDAGHWFRGVAQETLARVARLPDDARAVAGAASATLRFAATHALSLSFLPPWLRRLEAQALGQPMGTVQLVSDVLQQCELLMQQGRAQFLLCHAHAQVPGRLPPSAFTAVRVGTDALLPVSAPDESGAPLHALPTAPSGQRAGHRVALLDYSAESGLGRLVRALRDPVLAQAGVSVDTVFTAHLATVLRTMALQGRGVAWLPQSLVEADLQQSLLVPAAPGAAPLLLDICLVRRIGNEPPAAEAFWQAVLRAHGPQLPA